MEWFWKGMVTMVTVAVVLVLARRWGGSAAGLVAGLPTTTAPALAWMAIEHGVGFAGQAAAATVAACALMAAFALAYAHAATARCRPGTAMVCGAAGALALAGPVLACGSGLVGSLALGLGSCTVALLAWPKGPGGRCHAAGRAVRLPATVPAATAGGVSLGLGLAGPAIGTVCAGLLASLPVVSVTVAMAQHAVSGPAAARQFLHGTVAGLLGRVAFGAVFAVALPATSLAATLALALSAAVLVNLAAARALGCGDRQQHGATRAGLPTRSGRTAPAWRAWPAAIADEAGGRPIPAARPDGVIRSRSPLAHWPTRNPAGD